MNDLELLAKAREARLRAYAPYSAYLVGAALRDETGRIWVGCNVENVSFGATICAERTALCSMIAGGGKKWTAIVVITKDGGTPCGVCRQVMQEFACNPQCPVTCATPDEIKLVTSIAELLPFAFETDELISPNEQ